MDVDGGCDTATDECFVRNYSNQSHGYTQCDEKTARRYKALLLSGDGVVGVHYGVALIAPTLRGLKDEKKLQVASTFKVEVKQLPMEHFTDYPAQLSELEPRGREGGGGEIVAGIMKRTPHAVYRRRGLIPDGAADDTLRKYLPALARLFGRTSRSRLAGDFSPRSKPRSEGEIRATLPRTTSAPSPLGICQRNIGSGTSRHRESEPRMNGDGYVRPSLTASWHQPPATSSDQHTRTNRIATCIALDEKNRTVSISSFRARCALHTNLCEKFSRKVGFSGKFGTHIAACETCFSTHRTPLPLLSQDKMMRSPQGTSRGETTGGRTARRFQCFAHRGDTGGRLHAGSSALRIVTRRREDDCTPVPRRYDGRTTARRFQCFVNRGDTTGGQQHAGSSALRIETRRREDDCTPVLRRHDGRTTARRFQCFAHSDETTGGRLHAGSSALRIETMDETCADEHTYAVFQIAKHSHSHSHLHLHSLLMELSIPVESRKRIHTAENRNRRFTWVESCSISGGFASGFSHVRIVPDDAGGRRVFVRDLSFPLSLAFRRCSVLTLPSPSSALKASICELRARSRETRTKRVLEYAQIKFVTQKKMHFRKKPERKIKLSYGTSGPGVDYGSLASTTPDLGAEELEDKKSAFLESLKLPNEDRKKVWQDTAPHAQSFFVAKGTSGKDHSFLDWGNSQDERHQAEVTSVPQAISRGGPIAPLLRARDVILRRGNHCDRLVSGGRGEWRKAKKSHIKIFYAEVPYDELFMSGAEDRLTYEHVGGPPPHAAIFSHLNATSSAQRCGIHCGRWSRLPTPRRHQCSNAGVTTDMRFPPSWKAAACRPFLSSATKWPDMRLRGIVLRWLLATNTTDVVPDLQCHDKLVSTIRNIISVRPFPPPKSAQCLQDSGSFQLKSVAWLSAKSQNGQCENVEPRLRVSSASVRFSPFELPGADTEPAPDVTRRRPRAHDDARWAPRFQTLLGGGCRRTASPVDVSAPRRADVNELRRSQLPGEQSTNTPRSRRVESKTPATEKAPSRAWRIFRQLHPKGSPLSSAEYFRTCGNSDYSGQRNAFALEPQTKDEADRSRWLRAQTISVPTSVQSMSRQSQCSRVLQAPSRAVGFTRRPFTPRTPRPPLSRNLLSSSKLHFTRAHSPDDLCQRLPAAGLRQISPNTSDASRWAEAPASLTRTFLRRRKTRRNLQHWRGAVTHPRRRAARQSAVHYSRVSQKRGSGGNPGGMRGGAGLSTATVPGSSAIESSGDRIVSGTVLLSLRLFTTTASRPALQTGMSVNTQAKCAACSSSHARNLLAMWQGCKVLKAPILPRKDNHHVRVDVIADDGFITKSIKNAFTCIRGPIEYHENIPQTITLPPPPCVRPVMDAGCRFTDVSSWTR
ncbi:hypothetical protein PR048_032744 [Dryococelus australis]|uniref:Uncharacterized protein n=1 Tax=Dryococelus australis TaxID=614101 RepID=A0ABQ9G485_9NEOP|nr:hypothetical protein PR048_032744 [Dryococelus australis]